MIASEGNFLKFIYFSVVYLYNMPVIRFTKALRRFFPDLRELHSSSESIGQIMDEIDSHFPGITNYILDEQKSLRKHVNIFIDGEMMNDRERLSDPIRMNSEIYIIQALSGG